MSAFWALVQNDLQARRFRHRRNVFRRIFFILALFIGIIAYTYGIFLAPFPPQYLPYFLQGLIFIPFAFAFSHIHHEWRNGTVSWWLALPYSRKKLLGAKLTAIYLRSMRVLAFIVVFMILLALEAMLLRPGIWTGEWFLQTLLTGGEIILYFLVMSPFLTMLAIALGVLQHSVWRPAMPLFWLLFVLFLNAFNIFNGYNIGVSDKFIAPFTSLGFPLISLLVGLFVLIGPLLLFLLSAYVLERQTEI